jgi:membrane protein DedA with SNARE-associated domain
VISRYFTEKNKNKIQSWFVKYGFFIYFIAIYIPGMYLPVVFFSGMLKHKRKSALTGIMLATLIHDFILFLSGRVVGSNLKKIASFLSIYRNYVLCIVGVFAVAFIIYLFFRYRKPVTRGDSM